ncbi:MAG: PaaI family thioesterase [Candidatus Dormibacteraceae bacterium]
MPPNVTVEELNQILGRQEFARRYRFRVTAAGDGTCEMLIPYLPENDRPGGIVSGQVYMHAADVAFWFAVKTRLGTGEEYVTSSMTTAFLGAARGHDFTCHARVIKTGRRLIYGDAECRTGDKTLTHHTLTYVSAAG